MVGAVTRLLYVITGAVFLVAGASVLSLGLNILPASIRQHVVDIAGGDSHVLHVFQELSSLLVFAGLMAFWFAWRYDQSRFFHWALTLFWALFAGVHWFDTSGHFHSGTSQFVITIPFITYAVVGLMRCAAKC